MEGACISQANDAHKGVALRGGQRRASATTPAVVSHGSYVSQVAEESKKISIPAWEELRRAYDVKWLEEKEKFQGELRENFDCLVSQYKSGRQAIYDLGVGRYHKYYEQAFRELFADTGYQATVGETERLGTGEKKQKKLYITLPQRLGD